MRFLTIALVLFLFVACQVEKKTENKPSYQFYLGTYTDGDAQGIYKCSMTSDGVIKEIRVVAKSNNPSFLAFDADKKHLLAVNEVSQNGVGTVEAYRIKKDTLEYISKSSSGGAHPCHISLSKDGIVAVSNYSGGNIGWLRIGQDGKLSELLHLSQHNNADDTSVLSHAHSAWFLEGSQEVMAVDLGTDELWQYSFALNDDSLNVTLLNKHSLAKGAGPRHMAEHPNGKYLYVINELSNSITTLNKNERGEWQIGASISTLPADFDGESYCADVRISADGRFLYGSNRGHNSIVIFSIANDGSLKLLAHESVRGDHPRNFSLTPDGELLLVANKNTNNIVSFKRDKTSGLLELASEIKTPSPVCILFE
ncbi:lactonase family protein [Carboxylicivirga sp. N1Y90]|uniref:lactonase family protein n=1 Tax=Carboxylicivirga fragile TaxID=3417571 RepID=UPI003D33B28B|nr:lactonase family protein [Marinilabiliaceae bacterium N1Y90]